MKWALITTPEHTLSMWHDGSIHFVIFLINELVKITLENDIFTRIKWILELNYIGTLVKPDIIKLKFTIFK